MVSYRNLDQLQYESLRNALIVQLEGGEPEAYLDSVGIPTIGIGLNLQVQANLEAVLNELGVNLLTPDGQALSAALAVVAASTYASNDALQSAIETVWDQSPARPVGVPDFSLTIAQQQDLLNLVAETYEIGVDNLEPNRKPS